MKDKGNYHLKEQTDTWYKMNNIVHEKCELFKDFYLSLIQLIDDTYLGTDIFMSEIDINQHFNWCINHIKQDFKHEKIFFKDDGQHMDVLYLFFYDIYYTSDDPNKTETIKNYLRKILEYNDTKTLSEINVLVEFYKLMDKTLIK